MNNRQKDVIGLICVVGVGALVVATFGAIRGDDFAEGYIFGVTNLPMLVVSTIVGMAVGAIAGERLGAGIAGAIIGGLSGAAVLYPVVASLLLG